MASVKLTCNKIYCPQTVKVTSNKSFYINIAISFNFSLNSTSGNIVITYINANRCKNDSFDNV